MNTLKRSGQKLVKQNRELFNINESLKKALGVNMKLVA